ncbi:TraR/DksA C4-type zinc finger protein [Paenibacillus sp. JSM ZJ436]|uniref:TraR/DksA C4-type zinc finger protein n=1 Tax=Paenibacillus sp. JSM ZJ436 TaxID=3376190 RepID=UPI0037A9A9DA
MSHLSEKQKETLKARLQEEKERLEQHFRPQEGDQDERLSDESLRESTGELSSADNHPGDIGTETFERSRDLAIDESLTQEQDDIENAFERMEKGTYGTCAECGQDIPYERLEAIPYTAYCVEHTPEQNRSDRRPAEEEVITTPPGGAGIHRQQAEGKFDDAGAWDSVEQYGTATSPAMDVEPGEDDYHNEGKA